MKQWLKRLFGRGEPEPNVRLFCPNREDKVPIASEYAEPERVSKDTGVAAYRCKECGGMHCWQWGPPAPIYVGDKIKIKFSREGVSVVFS